jgi:hypothetical protein
MTACLGTTVLLLLAVANGHSSEGATGRFEVYCDGVGLSLAKVDGAPAPRKLLLFLYTGFPGVSYVPKDEWKDVKVYRNGCAADGKCEVLAHGRIRLDNEITPDSRHVSGGYEIDFTGQHLHGTFTAERRRYKHPPRICE